jgi:hypothetical protein
MVNRARVHFAVDDPLLIWRLPQWRLRHNTGNFPPAMNACYRRIPSIHWLDLEGQEQSEARPSRNDERTPEVKRQPVEANAGKASVRA